jgi:hypothetical protein
MSAEGGGLDNQMRIGMVFLFFLWNVLIATRLETPYPESLVEAYALPASRILLLGLVILAAIWSPTVGIMAAFAFVCLGADVLFLTRGASR